MAARFGALALGLLTAACAAGTTTVNRHGNRDYVDASYIRHAASAGGFTVAVHNPPRGEAITPAVQRTIEQALQTSSGVTHDVAFDAEPDASAYTVRVVFHPADSVQVQDLCAVAEPATRVRDGGRVPVAIAWCDGETTMQWVTGAHTAMPDLDTGKLDRLMRGVGYELFAAPLFSEHAVNIP